MNRNEKRFLSMTLKIPLLAAAAGMLALSLAHFRNAEISSVLFYFSAVSVLLAPAAGLSVLAFLFLKYGKYARFAAVLGALVLMTVSVLIHF